MWNKGPLVITSGAVGVADAPHRGAGVTRGLGPSIKKQMGNFTRGSSSSSSVERAEEATLRFFRCVPLPLSPCFLVEDTSLPSPSLSPSSAAFSAAFFVHLSHAFQFLSSRFS